MLVQIQPAAPNNIMNDYRILDTILKESAVGYYFVKDNHFFGVYFDRYYKGREWSIYEVRMNRVGKLIAKYTN